MCGRFSQAADLQKLARRFGLAVKFKQEDFVVKPRYNLAPSEMAPAIMQEGGGKRLEFMTWGLTRQWDKSKAPLFIINLKVEKLATGPFKGALSKRRCLIPADGFYEWKTEGRKKLPFRFAMRDDSIFAFPAIYDEPELHAESPLKHPALAPSRSFCIFTTPANPLVAAVHHRQPAILPPDLEDAWLEADLTDLNRLVAMLTSFPPDKMKSWPVSPDMNSGRIDSPEILKPI